MSVKDRAWYLPSRLAFSVPMQQFLAPAEPTDCLSVHSKLADIITFLHLRKLDLEQLSDGVLLLLHFVPHCVASLLEFLLHGLFFLLQFLLKCLFALPQLRHVSGLHQFCLLVNMFLECSNILCVCLPCMAQFFLMSFRCHLVLNCLCSEFVPQILRYIYLYKLAFRGNILCCSSHE
jgi:hypothetical protein